MSDRWYMMTPERVVSELNTDAVNGLSARTARLLGRSRGVNSVYRVERASVLRCAADVILDLGTLLLALTVALSALLENGTEAAAIFTLLVVSAAVETTAYIGSRRVLEDAARFCIPRARVIRGGAETGVDATEVVKGDLLIFGAGDSVPCDCRLISASGLTVSERSITGNTKPVAKSAASLPTGRELPPDAQTNMLFAGSSVLRGAGRAVAVEVGEDTLVYAVHGGISPATHDRLPAFASLKKYCRAVSLVMLAVVMALTLFDMLTDASGLGLSTSFITSMALAVASMSEFFTSIGSIIVANAVKNAAGGGYLPLLSESGGDYDDRLSAPRKMTRAFLGAEALTSGVLRDGAVIKNIASISRLKNVDSILMRDTDALRTGRIEPGDYFAGGVFVKRSDKPEPALVRLLREALLTAGVEGGAELPALADAEPVNGDAAVIKTLLDSLAAVNAVNYYDNRKIAGTVTPSDENSIYHTALLVEEGAYTTLTRGGVASVLRNCATYKAGDAVKPLTAEVRRAILDAAALLERKTARVYAVASKPSIYNSLRRISVLQSDMCFNGFYSVAETLTAGTDETVVYLRGAGIEPVLLVDTADATAGFFGARAGFSTVGDPAAAITPVFAAEIRNADDDTLDRITSAARVYAGLTAADRERVVASLKRQGKTTAYIGGGSSDSRVLAASDAAFACEAPAGEIQGDFGRPASGTARTAADVLVRRAAPKHGGIHDAVTALAYAKTAYVNLKAAASYLLVSQTARLALVAGALLFGYEIMTPTQILTWGLLVDLAAVFVIASEPPQAGILSVKNGVGDKVISARDVAVCALFGLLWAALTAVCALIASSVTAQPPAGSVRGAVFISALLCSAAAAGEANSRKSLFRRGGSVSMSYFVYVAAAVLLSLLLLSSPDAAALFGAAVPGVAHAAASLLPPMFMLAAFELYKRIRS